MNCGYEVSIKRHSEPNRSLRLLEWGLGVSPIHAAKWRVLPVHLHEQMSAASADP
jgi:hypothetical protein